MAKISTSLQTGDFPEDYPETKMFPENSRPMSSGSKNSQKMYEEVDHPQHYNAHPAGIECIDVIEVFPHNIGAAMKYLWRAGLKPGSPPLQDLRKALWYVQREISRLEKTP